VVPNLAVVDEIQSDGFFFLIGPQPNQCLHDIGDHNRGNHGQCHCQRHGLELLDPKGMPDDSLEIRREISVHFFRCQKAGQDRSQRAADTVDTESVKGIVVLQPRLQLGASQIRDDPGQDTDDHGPGGGDEARCRCDDDQSAHRPGTKAEHSGLAIVEPLGHRPCGCRHRGCERGGHEGVGRDAVGRNGGSGVETVPSHPEHAGADGGEDQAVRREVQVTESLALAQDDHQDQGRPARAHVDHGAPGEVDRLDGCRGVQPRS